MLPSADCAAKVLSAASETSALSRTQQSMLSPLGAVAQGHRQLNTTPRIPLDIRPVSPGPVQLIRRSASPCRCREVTPRRSPGSYRQLPLLQLCMADNAARTAVSDPAGTWVREDRARVQGGLEGCQGALRYWSPGREP